MSFPQHIPHARSENGSCANCPACQTIQEDQADPYFGLEGSSSINRSGRNATIRRDSGRVSIDSKLVAFFYILGRDFMPLGVVEELFRKLVNPETGDVDSENHYTNGWLAEWAQHYADQLRDPEPLPEPIEVGPDPGCECDNPLHDHNRHEPDISDFNFALTSNPPAYRCSNPKCYSHPVGWTGWNAP